MSAAKETTLKEVGEMLTHVVTHMATKEDVARLDKGLDDLRTEMIDKFEHADKQFEATHDRLRDMSAEIAVIHRPIERLEEQGASNAGFAKEIDHLLARVASIGTWSWGTLHISRKKITKRSERYSARGCPSNMRCGF